MICVLICDCSFCVFLSNTNDQNLKKKKKQYYYNATHNLVKTIYDQDYFRTTGDMYVLL